MTDIIKKENGNSYSVIEAEQIEDITEAVEENNKLLFRPEFIPFYLEEVKRYGFSNTEGLLYGFIRFYLKNNPRGKFYFTNEQLAYMLDVSPQTISNSIAKICKCGEFKVTYKVKADGGTFRLLENYESDYKKLNSPTIRKFIANKNKINKNNINIYICSFEEFWKLYPKKVSKKKSEDIYKRKVTSKKKEEVIMKGLEKYIKKWHTEKTDIKYIPNPTTWLNQERWEDDVIISNEQYNQNARKFEEEMNKVKEQEKRSYKEYMVDDGKGGLIKLSELRDNYLSQN